MKSPLALLLALGLIASACDEESDDPAETPAGGTTTHSGTSTGIAELQGTWVQACQVSGSTSSKNTLVISGENATADDTSYSDATCTTKDFTGKWTGTIAAAGDATTPAGAKKYNFTFATLSYTAHNATMAAAFNSISLCELSDWVAGTEKNVLGKKCDEDNPNKIINAGTISYDIYKLTGTTELALGLEDDTNSGDTDATRIVALDPQVYTKQ